MDSEQTSKLLLLPREIRYQIFDHVLHYSAQAPQGSQIISRWIRISDKFLIWSATREGNPSRREIRETFPRLTRAADLHLVCQQLHSELLFWTSTRSKQRPVAALDILVSGYRFLPTWTSIPILLSKAHAKQGMDIVVDLRILSGEALWPHEHESGTSLLPPAFCLLVVLLESLDDYILDMQISRDEMRSSPTTMRHASFRMQCLDRYSPSTFNELHEALVHCLARTLDRTSLENGYFDHFSVSSTSQSSGEVKQYAMESTDADIIDDVV